MVRPRQQPTLTAEKKSIKRVNALGILLCTRKGFLLAVHAGLLACDLYSHAAFPFLTVTVTASFRRSQLRGSAGFAPASRAREPLIEKEQTAGT
jgi:hypothetical protein